jgi:uncharacterized protein YecT (DUF1311 family)
MSNKSDGVDVYLPLRIAALVMTPMFGAVGVCAADDALYPVRDCGQLTTQMEINQCTGANREAADLALNKIYQELSAQQSDASSKEQLKGVERAWIVYRDKECAFEVGPQQGGGSIWPMEMSNCLEQLTAARIDELSKLRGCTAGVSACNPH